MIELDYTKPGEVVHAYCFNDTHLPYSTQQIRRFVSELGAVALHHLFTSHKYRQIWINLDDFDYFLHVIISNTYTDQPELFTQHVLDWTLWMKQQGIFHRLSNSPHIKTHILHQDIMSRLNPGDNVSFQMARELLDQGFPAKDFYTQQARTLLAQSFYDESYVNSFFIPPPNLFWQNQCFHSLEKIYPKSPLSYPYDSVC